MTKKRAEEQNGGNDDEPNFEDPEDFVDDVSEEGEFGKCHELHWHISKMQSRLNWLIDSERWPMNSWYRRTDYFFFSAT